MARLSTLLLLTALLDGTTAFGALPIAPVEPFVGEMPSDELNPDSATNGRSTLVLWENRFHPSTTSSVYGRFMDRDAALPFLIEPAAWTAAVGSDGQDYLVAYGIASSRFNTTPYDSVMVRLVTADGVVGARKAIHNSAVANGPAIGDVAWTGRYWLVAFTDATSIDPKARVAFVGRDLEPALPTLELGPADAGSLVTPPHLAEIAGDWWAIFPTGTSTLAVEIRADGTAGRRHSIVAPPGVMTPTGRGALFGWYAPTAEGSRVAVATFDPAAGFGPATITTTAGKLADLRTLNGTVVAVVREDRPTSSWIDGLVLDDNGSVLHRSRLLTEEQATSARLREGSNGPLLLVTSSVDALSGVDTRTGLYAWAFPMPPAPLDRRSRHLVSAAAHGRQLSPVIGSNGQSLVAFWSQTVDDRGHIATFSRQVTDDGAPMGEPVLVPFVMNVPDVTRRPDLAFDGERFLLVWDDGANSFAASVSADGRNSSFAVELGRGLSPRVAAHDGAAFVIWTLDGVVRGTPLRRDGSPEVQGGFAILPSFTSAQSSPDIAPTDGGFLLVWAESGVRSLVIGASGAPRSSSQLAQEPGVEPVLVASEVAGGGLATWRRADGSSLLTFRNGGRPFDAFDPPWGRWSPVALEAAGAGRYLVAFEREGALHVAEMMVTAGGYVGNLGKPRAFAPASAQSVSIAPTNAGAVAIWSDGSRVFVGSGSETRRRSVARR